MEDTMETTTCRLRLRDKHPETATLNQNPDTYIIEALFHEKSNDSNKNTFRVMTVNHSSTNQNKNANNPENSIETDDSSHKP